MAFQIKVNGRVRAVDTDGDTPLLWVLRDHPDLTGTNFGCGIARWSGPGPRPVVGGGGVAQACRDAGCLSAAAF